jgi:hypothetical protein
VSLGGGGRRHFLPHFVRFQQVAAPFPSDLPASQVSGGYNTLLRYLILDADSLVGFDFPTKMIIISLPRVFSNHLLRFARA